LEHSQSLDQRKGKVCPLNGEAVSSALTIRVKPPESEHTVSVGKSPNEHEMKSRLREIL
jgi:hypothetical protein